MVLNSPGKYFILPVPVINVLFRVFLFFTPFIVSGQQAELTVNVLDPLGIAAGGTVTVTGPDTSIEKVLANGIAFFVLNGFSGVDDNKQDDLKQLYPNPVGRDGIAVLELPSLDGIIEVYSVFGHKIGEWRAADTELSFPFDPGIGIIIYTARGGKQAVFKVINPSGHYLNLTIRENGSSPLKKSIATDGYYIVYRDPEKDLTDISCTKMIYEGSTCTENFYPPYSLKGCTMTGKTSGLSLVLVKNPSNEIIGFYETGTDGKIAPFSLTDAYSKKTGENASVEITGYNADTLTYTEPINAGDTITVNQLLNRHYTVKVICSTIGFNFSVTDDAGFLGSGASQALFKRKADSLYVDITGSASGYRTSHLDDVLVKPGLTWYSMALTLADSIFVHTLTVRLASSEALEGHSVRNPYVDITTSIGTNRKTLTNGTVVYTWDSDVKNENVTYDIGLQGTGHKDITAASLTVGITPVTVERVAEANDWTGNLTINVKDSKTGLNVSGAAISTSQVKAGTTNTTGDATLIGYSIDENAYSEAINTAVTYTISRTDYIDTTGNLLLVAGENTLKAKLRPVPTYTHSLIVNLLSDEAGEGHKVKDSPISFTTSLGTTTLTTADQTITYTWVSKRENENVIYDIDVSGGGHADVGAKSLNIGTLPVTENITLAGYDFAGNITFNVKDSETHDNVSGAGITTSQSKSGTTDTSGNATFTGYIIDENEFSEAKNTKIGYTIEYTGYTTKNDTVPILAGNNTVSEILTPIGAQTYPHSLTVNLISDETGEGHKVKDSPVSFTTSQGTTTLTSVGQTVTHTWTSKAEIENVTFDIIVTGGGHAGLTGIATSVGTTPVTWPVTLTGNDYTGNITFNIKDSKTNLNIEGATVSTLQNKSGTTDTSGNVTFAGYVIGENEFSEAISTAISYAIERTGYTMRDSIAGINAGNNAVNETLNPIPPTYSHSLTINLVSDESGEGHFVKDSPVDFTTSLGTETRTTNGQTFTYTWTSNVETENVMYAITVTGSGHGNVQNANVNVGTTSVTENVILLGNDYSGNITFHITDNTSTGISGAGISTDQSKTATTDGNGDATITGYIINENIYSEPDTTTINYVITATGYTMKNGIAAIIPGNNTVNETLVAE